MVERVLFVEGWRDGIRLSMGLDEGLVREV